jgi:uncharacterized membrane protein YgcG
VRGDPAATGALIAAKQKTWKAAAEEIERDDPDAYEYLTGRRADRTANALWVLAASFTLTLTLLALGLLGACYLVVRFVVMTAPVWAVIAVLPGRQRVLRKAVVLVGVSVLFGTGMAVLVPVHVLVTGHLLYSFVTDRRAERAPKKKEEDQEQKGAPTGAPAGPGGDGPGGGGVGDGVGGGGPAGAGRSGPNPNPDPTAAHPTSTSPTGG